MKTILDKENKSELKRIQRIIINQMNRLDDEDVMKEKGKREIARSGALSQQACAYIKSIQIQTKILELSGKYNVNMQDMNKFLGIEESDS